MLQIYFHQIAVERVEKGVYFLVQIVSVHHVLESPYRLLDFLRFLLELVMTTWHNPRSVCDRLFSIPGELLSQLQSFEGDMRFVLLGIHGQFLAEGEDEQR